MQLSAEQFGEMLNAIKSGSGPQMWQLLVFVLVVGLCAYIGAYLREKGRSVATKKDVADITEKIESVKAEVAQTDRIHVTKYELKYRACLKLLEIMDAHVSHALKIDNQGNKVEIPKQFTTEPDVRKCHNELLLTIDNPDVIRLFVQMMTGKSKNLMVSLDELRLLIRKELGFGEKYYADQESTWIGIVTCKKA